MRRRVVGPVGARILVAEDNLINQKVVCMMMKKLGYQAAIAPNGSEAFAAWASGAFDAILMDCQMPVMSGFDATRAIRSSDRAPQIPIIAMTANTMPEDRGRCLEAGMDDYMAKPVRKETLQKILQRWLGERADERPSVAAV